jgi:hypothetical protein
MSAAAGASAAAAAARRREELRIEEEQETAPMAADDGYEYKILRSNWSSFKSPTAMRSALEYEAQFGWDLFEKLDNSRLRMRRPIQCREQDAERTHDPYRIWVGPSDKAIGVFVVVAMVVVVALIIGLATAMH